MQDKRNMLEAKINKEYPSMRGLLIWKDGVPIYESYFKGCDEQSHIHVYSVTKSILSLLIGVAIDQGYIKGLHQRVLDFFPEYHREKSDEVLAEITLYDIMTMRAPYRYKDSLRMYMKYFCSKDYLNFTLDQLGGKAEIGGFRYTPIIGLDILSGVLMRACGQSVLSFAQQYVFEPLDIHVEKDIYFHNAKEQMQFNKAIDQSGWVQDFLGLHTGGWGLTLTLRDMAKIGQLCLDRGRWKDTQIISSSYIDACMSEQNRCKKEQLSYGYLWWVEPNTGFMAMGDGGNVIYVNTQKRLVIAMHGMYKRKDKDRISLIKKEIEPIFM